MIGGKPRKDDIIQDLQHELSTFYLTFFHLSGKKKQLLTIWRTKTWKRETCDKYSFFFRFSFLFELTLKQNKKTKRKKKKELLRIDFISKYLNRVNLMVHF